MRTECPLTAHPHLGPRSRMSRSYKSFPTCTRRYVVGLLYLYLILDYILFQSKKASSHLHLLQVPEQRWQATPRWATRQYYPEDDSRRLQRREKIRARTFLLLRFTNTNILSRVTFWKHSIVTTTMNLRRRISSPAEHLTLQERPCINKEVITHYLRQWTGYLHYWLDAQSCSTG
jgi:hypothetical protein